MVAVMGRDARISHRTGFPLSSAKAPHCQSCGTAPRSHITLTTILGPFLLITRELSSTRALAIAVTESEGLREDGGQDDAPNRREKAGSLPVVCREAESALSAGLVIPAVLTGHKEHLLLCEDDCERGKRQTQASAEFRASTERQRTAVVVVAHNVGDCRHDGQRDGARSAE